MPHRLIQFADAKLAEEAFSILLMTYGLFAFVGIHRSGTFFYSSYCAGLFL